MIGLGMGGLETLRTGSLGKGLAAGLGAYGGAGLAGGLMGAGAQGLAGDQIASEAAKNATAEGIQLAPGYAQTAAATATPEQIAAAKSGASGFDLLGRGASHVASGGANSSGLMGLAKSGWFGLAPAMMAMPQTITPQGSGPNPYRYRYELENPPQAPFTDSSREARQMIGRYVPYAEGGTVQQMSDQNAALTLMANGGQMLADGGVSHLGDYSDGGRLLKGPGDGVSDSIPATIADKRPARLADGEFVVPARIVSELGNGSTDAGARKLYAMMDRVQKARSKTTGKSRMAVDSRADKALPA